MDTADLREGIFDVICAGVPAVANRVYWGWTAPADTPKPYIVMTFGADLPPASGNPCGVFQEVDIEVYGEEANILAIDPIADLVMSVLHQQPTPTPAGRIIYLKYAPGSRVEGWVEEMRASIVRIKFTFGTDLWF